MGVLSSLTEREFGTGVGWNRALAEVLSSPRSIVVGELASDLQSMIIEIILEVIVVAAETHRKMDWMLRNRRSREHSSVWVQTSYSGRISRVILWSDSLNRFWTVFLGCFSWVDVGFDPQTGRIDLQSPVPGRNPESYSVNLQGGYSE